MKFTSIHRTLTPLSVATGLALLALPSHAAPTAIWKFDGDTTEQVSSTVGTLLGSAATNGTPIAPGSSNSLSLPSSGSQLETNTNGGLGGTGSFTVLVFFNTTTTSDGGIFSYNPTGGVAGGADLRLLVLGNGNLRIEMSAGAGFELSGAGDLGDGNNHMVAAVFNSATGDSFQDVDLYVDGTFYNVTGGTDHPINLAYVDADDEVFFGRGTFAANRPFVGRIDDAAIFNEALSLSALDDIRANGVPVTGSAPFQVRITANGSTPGNYDFEWDSKTGMVYDLVSSTSLSTAPDTWPVWDGRSDIASGGAITSLANVPGGGDAKRFFAVVEKAP